MRRFYVVLAVVLAFMFGGVAWASIPGPDGVIHGCYKTGNPNPGSVIVIDSAASCPNGYAALNWDQQGGLSTTTKVESNPTLSFLVENGYAASASVMCPSGSHVTGGGYDRGQGNVDLRVYVDGPAGVSGSPPTGWIVGLQNPVATQDFQLAVHVFAVCAS